MPRLPEISVIIPVFNGAAFLRDAVASVLCQNHPATEIIIVDDGSTDVTPHIIASLPPEIRSLRQDNRGASAARNTGLAVARGNLICFLDVDDVWPTDKFELQLPILEQHSQKQIVQGFTQLMVPGGDKDEVRFRPFSEPWYLPYVCSAVFRRTAFDTVGLFDESMRLGEDIDWFLRAREKNVPMQIIKQVTSHYRLHQSNTTIGSGAQQRNILRSLKLSLDRRRQVDGVTPTPMPSLPVPSTTSSV